MSDRHAGERTSYLWVGLTGTNTAHNAPIMVTVEHLPTNSRRYDLRYPALSHPRTRALLNQEVDVSGLPFAVFVRVEPPALPTKIAKPTVKMLGGVGRFVFPQGLAEFPHAEGFTDFSFEPEERCGAVGAAHHLIAAWPAAGLPPRPTVRAEAVSTGRKRGGVGHGGKDVRQSRPACRPTPARPDRLSPSTNGKDGSLLTSVEICTGAGGQALGLEQAGFEHRAVVENDPHACNTLRANRREWNVIEEDLLTWDPTGYEGIDLLAGGVPCPPFSKAGRQLGADDERDLFPRAIHLVEALKPKAVMLENVRGLLDVAFQTYRTSVEQQLKDLGYRPGWRLLNASDFGVPQLRPRVIFVAIRDGLGEFHWPVPHPDVTAPTVGQELKRFMAANGWEGADAWAEQATSIAPTLVGGSKKHGGPDLGPTRARRAWAALGVNGSTLAEHAPEPGFDGMPRLTVQMAARIQGFPDDWEITGRKTNAYRQVGNAFPPPVAKAVGEQIKATLLAARNGLQVVA